MQDTNGSASGPERLLTPGEVGRMFRVDPKTVTRWAQAGKISSVRTPGGHRRFKESVHYIYYLGRRYTVIRDGATRLVWSHTNRSRLHFDRGSAR